MSLANIWRSFSCSNLALVLTERITMFDVSIVEVAHGCHADQGEHKNEEFLVIRPPLTLI